MLRRVLRHVFRHVFRYVAAAWPHIAPRLLSRRTVICFDVWLRYALARVFRHACRPVFIDVHFDVRLDMLLEAQI